MEAGLFNRFFAFIIAFRAARFRAPLHPFVFSFDDRLKVLCAPASCATESFDTGIISSISKKPSPPPQFRTFNGLLGNLKPSPTGHNGSAWAIEKGNRAKPTSIIRRSDPDILSDCGS
jgi:hypothetical protein